MSLKLTFWLPALAMAAFTLPTHLHTSQDARGTYGLLENVPYEVLASFPLGPKNTYLKPIGQKTPVTTTLPEKQILNETDGSIDIWERLRTGFILPQDVVPAVQAHIKYFRAHPHHIEQILERGEPYLYHILSVVEQRGLPTELALLPVIESSFDPFSRSPAGAVGIWQFMPATAKQFGLQRDWWFDGRKDIIEATEAALKYLSELHQRFDGDWFLALGAYNAGEARIKRAMRHNRSRGKPVSFWHLPIPKETGDYVPKLLAICAIISNPEAHNATLPDMPNAQYFTAVDIDGAIGLQVVAQLIGKSLDELQRLNPGLIRSITPPSKLHTLLIPTESEKSFREQLARLPTEQRVRSFRYRVRKGDTLSAIALNSRTTVTSLRLLNQLESTRINAGMLLMVPLSKNDHGANGELQTS